MRSSFISSWIPVILSMNASFVSAETLESIDNPLSNNSGQERKRGNGNSVAQVKRAAIKTKNRASNRAAHR